MSSRQICTRAFTDKDTEAPWALQVLFLISSVASATLLLPLHPLSPDRSPHEPDTLLPQDLCTSYSLFPSSTRCASSPRSGLRAVATFSVGPAYLEWHPAPTALPCSTPLLIFLPDTHLQVIDSLVIRFCLGSNKGRGFCPSHSQLYFLCLRPSLAMAGVPQITV